MATKQGYTVPTYLKPHGFFNSQGNWTPRAHGLGGAYAYHTVEIGVPVPNPGKVPPSAGHWRTNAKCKPQPKPRTSPRPTGGKVHGRGNPGNPVRKRQPRNHRKATVTTAF